MTAWSYVMVFEPGDEVRQQLDVLRSEWPMDAVQIERSASVLVVFFMRPDRMTEQLLESLTPENVAVMKDGDSLDRGLRGLLEDLFMEFTDYDQAILTSADDTRDSGDASVYQQGRLIEDVNEIGTPPCEVGGLIKAYIQAEYDRSVLTAWSRATPETFPDREPLSEPTLEERMETAEHRVEQTEYDNRPAQ